MQRRTILRALAGIGVSAVAILLVAQAADLPEALATIARVDLRLLVLPAAVVVLQMWLRAVRWGFVLSAMADAPIGGRQAMWPLTVGYLANTALPARIGEVVRIVAASRRLPVTVTAATASVVVERLVDLLALFALAAVAYAVVGDAGALPIAGAIAVLAAVGLVLRGGGWLAARLPRVLPAVVHDIARRFLLAFGAVRPGVVLRVWLVGLLVWACDAAVLWLCAWALGIQMAPGLAALLSMGAALGAVLPAASGALGTYELGAVAAGAAMGVSADAALQVALLAHLVGLTTIVGLGAVGAVILSLQPARGATQATQPEVAGP